ncbi:MAG: TrbC/VirB2 family protein [bacterium]|nr:TrbC/VirB2 family protein [bacterium]
MKNKKEKIKILFKTSFFLASFGLAPFARAACEETGGLKNPLISCSFAELVTNIAKIVAAIGVPIAVCAIIWAGFLFVTARGSEDQIKKAKTTFFWAIIGTAILLGAWALATAISGFVQGL